MRNAAAAVDHLPGHIEGWIVGRIISSVLDTIPGLMAAAPYLGQRARRSGRSRPAFPSWNGRQRGDPDD
eukprot:3815467-Heterocapsa_arctica.AAC.1